MEVDASNVSILGGVVRDFSGSTTGRSLKLCTTAQRFGLDINLSLGGSVYDLLAVNAAVSSRLCLRSVGANHIDPSSAALTSASNDLRIVCANTSGVVSSIISNDGGRTGTSADRGDAGASLTVGVDPLVNIWNTPLTAVRNANLLTTGVYDGARFKIIRTAAATGASALNVQTTIVRALALGQWCEVYYNANTTHWEEAAFGSL